MPVTVNGGFRSPAWCVSHDIHRFRYDIRHMNDIETDQDMEGMLKSASESKPNDIHDR
jgi:hypothetical protein